MLHVFLDPPPRPWTKIKSISGSSAGARKRFRPVDPNVLSEGARVLALLSPLRMEGCGSSPAPGISVGGFEGLIVIAGPATRFRWNSLLANYRT